MLKKAFVIILNSLVLTSISTLAGYLFFYFFEETSKTSFWKYCNYKIHEAGIGILLLTGLGYSVFFLLSIIWQKHHQFSERIIAFITGFVMATVAFLITYAFASADKGVLDFGYLANLFKFFCIGFILPYSHNIIDNGLSKLMPRAI